MMVQMMMNVIKFFYNYYFSEFFQVKIVFVENNALCCTHEHPAMQSTMRQLNMTES